MSENNTGRGAAYRQNRPEKTYEVTLPSGAVFVLRKFDPQIFALTGALPLTLADKMAKLQKRGASDEATFQALSVDEQTKSIDVMNKIVRKACVNPRIVDYPQSDDEIAPEDLLLEDYMFIVQWVQSAGGESDSLNSFRNERQPDAVVELDIPEFQQPPVALAQNQ